MSQHTKSVSQHTGGRSNLAIRHPEGSVQCSHSHGEGRCRKRVLSADGKIVCGNGHQIPLYELFSEYLRNGQWTLESTGGIWPSRDAITAIVARVATPEFLRSTSEEWQHQMVSHWPFVSWLIHYAEDKDRKSAATLKEFLEREIRSRFPIINRYLTKVDEQESIQQRVRVRYSVLNSVGNWRAWRPMPEDYLSLWEICLKAAEYLSEVEHHQLFLSNVQEAAQCLRFDGVYCPIYFRESRDTERIYFQLLPDPCWRLDWCFNQINLDYRPDRGDIKWSTSHTQRDVVAAEFRKLRRDEGHRDQGYWTFHCDGSDHVDLNIPSGEPSGANFRMNAVQALKVVRELGAELGPNFGKRLTSK